MTAYGILQLIIHIIRAQKKKKNITVQYIFLGVCVLYILYGCYSDEF